MDISIFYGSIAPGSEPSKTFNLLIRGLSFLGTILIILKPKIALPKLFRKFPSEIKIGPPYFRFLGTKQFSN